MAELAPFRGVHYNPARVGKLSAVIAPPYDVIRAPLQEELYRRSPYNVVRLILGRDLPDDDPGRNKYLRAAQQYRQWLEDQVLVRDQAPSFYLYDIEFELKTPEGRQRLKRRGLLGRLRLSPYSERVVLPHERTLAGPKEDRFRLLSAARVVFSPVFVLFQDPEQELAGRLAAAAQAPAPWECREGDVVHRVWPITDPDLTQAITGFFQSRRLFLADGHHRYETGLRYLEEIRRTRPELAAGAEWTLAYLTAAEDPGLVVFPYHRLLHSLPAERLQNLVERLRQDFEVIPAPVSPLKPGPGRPAFIQALIEQGRTRPAFGLVRSEGDAYLLLLKPEIHRVRPAGVASRLDVTMLEGHVLEEVLALDHRALVEEKNVTYETDYDKVLDAVGRPPFQAAFLLNPTPVSRVLAVAEAGEIMPEKSTYFFPKPVSGLVFHPLD
jgi:uncharacterized protein (DUF1015 family)